MGNGVGKLNLCFAGVSAGDVSQPRQDIAIYLSDPLDEGFGHSFCYFRPDPSGLFPKDFTTWTATAMFKSISGASLSANTSTPLSTAPVDLCPSIDKASSFESSHSFASIPLQPVPRNSITGVRSGPIPRTSGAALGSGPIERGFKSGPIERSYISISGPLENQVDQLQRYKPNSKKWNLMKNLKRAIANSIVRPIRGVPPTARVSDWTNENGPASSDDNLTSADESSEESSFECPNVQWAQGKAGEDQVHIVISEEHGWVFVGIYDGFNGPDATDFLVNNLYANLHKELEGILWEDKSENEVIENQVFDICSDWSDKENYPSNENSSSRRKRRRKSTNGAKKWEREILENQRNDHEVGVKHSDVLKALSEALRKTEESYLEIADLMLKESPELSMMGSCVLGMLMKGEDVYLMNVGDSRAVLGRKGELDLGDLERINEESLNDFQEFDDGNEFGNLSKLTSLQLTMDHSTSVEEEVKRIKKEHLDDASAITNNRVKGSLKVTRAFGAGFLKKPKWNNALLKMLRINYVGNSPYINCLPSLYHHRLSPRDRFLILSSDGLYQYFTNKEAVSEVEMFISSHPEGDPAQHLVEEVLFRAAKKAGMDFHELLDIPQGERRKYHDDVSIIIISFEGRIWRSSV